MAKVLITRISSFGDVAMLVPVVFSVAARYPQDRFVVLTRKAFAPLFENLGFNIHAITFDKRKHAGLAGTVRLMLKVGAYGFSHVADVHDVLRTKLLRKWMLLLGKKVRHIDKGRGEKLDMISSKKVTSPLIPTTERYMDVFRRLGFNAEMVFENFFEFDDKSFYSLRTIATEKTGKWVGIAPFSKHKEKIYPLNRTEEVVRMLIQDPDISIFLFGAGSNEKKILDSWEKKYPRVTCVSGKINLMNELLLISYLDVMFSMDSANMHLASLVETPVVSVWGATHPNLGFYGFGQKMEDVIQTDIECRPCSVYGEIPCARGDYACLTRIKEETILNRIYIHLRAADIKEESDNDQSAVKEDTLSVEFEKVEPEVISHVVDNNGRLDEDGDELREANEDDKSMRERQDDNSLDSLIPKTNLATTEYKSSKKDTREEPKLKFKRYDRI